MHRVVHLHKILGEQGQLSRRLRLYGRLRSKVDSHVVQCLGCEHERGLSHHRHIGIVCSAFSGKAGLDRRSVADVISNHIFVPTLLTALSWFVSWLGLELHYCWIRCSQICLVFPLGRGIFLALDFRFRPLIHQGESENLAAAVTG